MADNPVDTAAIRQQVGQANGVQQPYDAVVFLPGIGDKAGQTLADVARRFTTTLDQRATTTDASFRYDDQSPAAVGIPGVSVCSIWRKDGPSERRIIDLYFLDYRLQLKQKYDDLSDVQRIVLLFFALVGSLRRYVARPLHLYKEVRPREWRLLGLRLLGIGAFSVLIFHWIYETRPGFLWVLRTRLRFPIKESPIPSYGPWWRLLGFESVVALAILIFAPRGKLPLRPWSRLTVAVLGLALIGTALVFRYGPNLYDLLLGSETAPVTLGLNDVLYIVLLLLAAFTIIAATGLSFGAVDEPLPDREQFQFLLWLLAMSNLVLYLGVLILAFFHTARQSAQPSVVATRARDAGQGGHQGPSRRSDPGQRRRANCRHFVIALGQRGDDRSSSYCPNYESTSSNFRNDDQIGPANFGIVLNPQDLAESSAAQRTGVLKPENYHFVGPFNAGSSSFFDLLTLYGIRSHTGYWGQDTVVEDNCFEAIIPWLYQGHPFLS